MPGIFGIIPTDGRPSDHDFDETLALVERMAAAMSYESWYATEVVACPTFGACVGRVGRSEGARIGDGEGLRMVVLTAGEPAVPKTSTLPHESLCVGVAAAELVQPLSAADHEALRGVDGAFAAFIADEPRSVCRLVSDRYGMERLFVYDDGRRTFFSSEAKAILVVAEKTRRFHADSLAEFLACGCPLGTQSLFEGIEVLEPGSVLTFRPFRRATRSRYFDPTSLDCSASVAAPDFRVGLESRLLDAVQSQLNRSARLGVSLTGGLDSRMIMACIEPADSRVSTYTFGSMFRATHDVRISRKVAAACRLPHAVIELGARFVAALPDLIEESVYISDGYIGLSGAAELFANRRARAFAPVRMTGNWGGELMRGMRAFKYIKPKGGFIRDRLLMRMQQSADAFASATSSHPLTFTLFHQLPKHGYGRYAIERSQLAMSTPFLSNSVVEWLYRAPEEERRTTAAAEALIARRPELLAVPTDLGFLGRGMSASLGWRHWLRKASFKAEYLVSHGAPNAIARATAIPGGGLLERMFLGRHKFQHFRTWIRTAFAAEMRELLLGDTAHGLSDWFDISRVRTMVDQHVAGSANYTDELDKLLTLAVASKTLFTPTPRARANVARIERWSKAWTS